jgi:hypothetical protein
MQINRSEYIQPENRQRSPSQAIAAVAVVVGSVGVSACGMVPLTVETAIDLPPNISAAPVVGDNDPLDTYSLTRVEPVALLLKTSGSPEGASPPMRATGYPNLMNALSRVSVRMKLQVLLTLLVAEADPADRQRFEAKLKALLKLPDDVLVEVLTHPDLAEFNTMLDDVFLGDTELWWVESQLAKIDIVPVTTTIDRIYVSGKPAFAFNSTAAAHAAANGGSSTSGLKSLASPPPPSVPAEPQVSRMMAARSAPEDDVTTYAAADSSEMQMSTFSTVAPAADDMAAVSSPNPAPPPEPPPAPPPPTNAELSQRHIETEQTLTTEVFDTGNSFEPGSFASPTPTNNAEPPTETAAAPPAAPPPTSEDGTPGDTTPGGNEDQGGPSAGDSSP